MATTIRTGRAARAVERCAHRIAQRDEEVRAWATLDIEAARARAAEVDAADALHCPSTTVGRLRGATLGVKDIVETADLPTSYGSPAFAGHRPARDADAVALLRAAGAVVLGKTVTTEMATYEPGPTRNPYHPEHTPGGSSSGSAAAVADGQVDLALGTQTAGSVIRPASFCGVLALKPTYGRWSMRGVLPVSLTFDTVGAFSRDTALLRATDAILAGPRAEHRPLPAIRALRVGVLRTPWWDRAEPEMQHLLESAAVRLDDHAAAVIDIHSPPWLADVEEAHRLLMAVEAASALREPAAQAGGLLSERLRGLLAEGAAIDAYRVQWSRRVLGTATDLVRRWFDEVDVLLAPAAPGEAPEGLGGTGDPVFTRLFSATGNPEVALPAGYGRRGLPLGLQLIGPHDSDQHLVYRAGAFAAVLGAVPHLPRPRPKERS